MKVSKKEDFGLIFMSILARKFSGEYISLADVSKETNMSNLFLKQIAWKLLKNKLITSKEGIGGGYRLARSPEQIRVSDIISSISGKGFATSCSTKVCRVVKSTCNCGKLWKNVNDRLFSYLDTISLSEFSKQ